MACPRRSRPELQFANGSRIVGGDFGNAEAFVGSADAFGCIEAMPPPSKELAREVEKLLAKHPPPELRRLVEGKWPEEGED